MTVKKLSKKLFFNKWTNSQTLIEHKEGVDKKGREETFLKLSISHHKNVIISDEIEIVFPNANAEIIPTAKFKWNELIRFCGES